MHLRPFYPAPRLTATALALILATPAFALTPDEVWANWQALSTASGATITASATDSAGGVLTVSGITMTVVQPGVEGGTTVTIDRMSFTGKPDGSVEVAMAEAIPMTMSVPETPGAPPVQIGLMLRQPGLMLTVSGVATDMAYDYKAPSFSVELTSLTLPDGSKPQVSFTGTGTDMAGRYVVAVSGDKTSMQSSGTIASFKMQGAGTDPATNSQITFSGSVAGLKAESRSVLLGPTTMQDIAAALKAGFMMDTSLSTGAITYSVSGQDVTGPVNITGGFSGTELGLKLDAEAVEYGFAMNGASFDAAVPDLPVPVRAGWGEMGFWLALPVAQTTDPQDYSASVRLVDVTMDETLWSMFDPGRQLKRDPMTLILDLAGQMAWTVDILAPGALEAAANPANLYSMDLKEVVARAFGAGATATGGLTFDTADLVTFGGIPAPTGKITVTLTGINALIDTAVSMGLMPEDQVMGVRMMMGMLARPGAGPDELVSEIEFKDKKLLINGAPIPM